MNKYLVSIAALVLALPLQAQVNQDLPAMATPDFDEFYLASEFSIPTTKHVYIDDVEVAFSRDWLRDYRGRTSSNYEERIFDKYGTALKKALTEDLSESGWHVSNEKSASTLILTPKIIELNIYAPNEPGIKQVIIRNAGHAKLHLTFSSPSGEAFMRVIDRRVTRENIGSPIVANRATNYRYFRMLFEKWSEMSVEYLNEVHDLVEQQAKNP